MKKLLLSTILLLSAFGFSQMTLKKLDGTVINNGDVLLYNALTDPEAYLGFKIYNSSSTAINIKAEVVSLTNTDGTNTQLCFGTVCASDVTEGTSYPNNPAIVPANGQNGNFDHFLNMNGGINTTQNVEYVLRFFMLDATGHETGNTIMFTYRYNANLATNSFLTLQEMGVQLKSNLVSNQLEFSNAAQAQIIDANGRIISQEKLEIGTQNIDISLNNSGVYFLKITNNNNQLATIKFIKN
jgi:Secretion system C-terminal sorting domain